MEGVIIDSNEKSGLFLIRIESLSMEFQEHIRQKLNHVCYGDKRVYRYPDLYPYQKTLIEFLKRFKEKKVGMQKGIIGELLTHLIILKYFERFSVGSPHFNMEDRGIKKGFDVILIEVSKLEVWYTEVKSGECHGESSVDKALSLFKEAESDIHGKLNEKRDSLWDNAVAGAEVVMREGDLKENVIKMIEGHYSNAVSSPISTDKSVILSSVLYNDISDKIDDEKLASFTEELLSKKKFKEVILVSIHKNTILKVVEFLEAECG